jgi:hypothetical protein
MSAILPGRDRQLFAVAGIGVPAAGTAAWLLLRFDPNAGGGPFLPCLFHAFTGLYCPGCGLTRALHALVHGDLARMVAMNALLPLLLVALPLLAVHGWGYRLALPRPVLRTLLSAPFWIGLVIGFGVLRNLPWWPFSWLAPG